GFRLGEHPLGEIERRDAEPELRREERHRSGSGTDVQDPRAGGREAREQRRAPCRGLNRIGGRVGGRAIVGRRVLVPVAPESLLDVVHSPARQNSAFASLPRYSLANSESSPSTANASTMASRAFSSSPSAPSMPSRASR